MSEEESVIPQDQSSRDDSRSVIDKNYVSGSLGRSKWKRIAVIVCLWIINFLCNVGMSIVVPIFPGVVSSCIL